MVKKKRGEGETGEEKGRGREVRLKTDQQPERLNTTACLCSDCRLKPLPLKLLRAVEKDNGSFSGVSLTLFHTRARTHTSAHLSEEMDCKKKLEPRCSPC